METKPIFPKADRAKEVRESLQRTKIAYIKVLIRGGHKINAIKYVRDNIGRGLKECKDYVDDLQKEINYVG